MIRRNHRAFTLAETLVALAVGTVLSGMVLASFITLQRTYAGCGQLAQNVTGGDRLLDYLSMDLRRALRINQGPVSTVNPLRGAGTRFVITDVNVLSITVPDYYASNASSGDSFSVARYPYPGDPNYRAATSATGWGQASFVNATRLAPNSTSNYTTAFVPPGTGSDELEVRYQRTTRALHDPSGSAGDQTVCIFRSEYKNGLRVSSLAREEIADNVEMPQTATNTPDLLAVNNLSLTSQDSTGHSFLLQFGYTSRLGLNRQAQVASVAATGASTVVVLRNPRRD